MKCPRVNNVPFAVDVQTVERAILSFPAGSSGGPDRISPQIMKDLMTNGNGNSATKLLRSLVKLINLVASGGVPEVFRPYFFAANLTALLKKDGGIRPIAVGNTFRRIVSKCAGAAVKGERKDIYGTTQLGYGLRGGAEAAAHSARVLANSNLPLDFFLIKVDFKNAFNSLRCSLTPLQVRTLRSTTTLTAHIRAQVSCFMASLSYIQKMRCNKATLKAHRCFRTLYCS